MLYEASALNALRNLKSSAQNLLPNNGNYQPLGSEESLVLPGKIPKQSDAKAASGSEAVNDGANSSLDKKKQQNFAGSREKLDAQDTKCFERMVSIRL